MAFEDKYFCYLKESNQLMTAVTLSSGKQREKLIAENGIRVTRRKNRTLLNRLKANKLYLSVLFFYKTPCRHLMWCTIKMMIAIYILKIAHSLYLIFHPMLCSVILTCVHGIIIMLKCAVSMHANRNLTWLWSGRLTHHPHASCAWWTVTNAIRWWTGYNYYLPKQLYVEVFYI